MSDNPIYVAYQQDADRREAIRLEIADEAQRAADAAEAERAALLAVEHAAEQAKADAAAAIVAEFSEADPPAGDVDVTGLAPMRARLARYQAWLKALETDLANLVAGRSQHLAAMGVPSVTKSSLDALIKADKTGLVAAMASGKGMGPVQLRAHERAQLERKLASDTHLAEVSRAAMDEVEAAIDSKSAAIEVVKGREGEFVGAALEEHVVQTAGAKLLAAVAEVRDAEMELLGATAHIQQLRGISYAQQTRRTTLPTPRLHIPGIRGAAGPGMVISGTADEPIPLDHAIEWPVHEQIQAQRRAAELAKQLAADPPLGTK